MTEAPETDHLYSDRMTLMYPHPMVKNPEDLDRYLQAYHVAYVLVAPEIKWMDTYKPEYSARANRMLPYLETLVAQKRVDLVYSSGPDLIKVYQVLRPPIAKQ
jgi:hypothetical protein